MRGLILPYMKNRLYNCCCHVRTQAKDILRLTSMSQTNFTRKWLITSSITNSFSPNILFLTQISVDLSTNRHFDAQLVQLCSSVDNSGLRVLPGMSVEHT